MNSFDSRMKVTPDSLALGGVGKTGATFSRRMAMPMDHI